MDLRFGIWDLGFNLFSKLFKSKKFSISLIITINSTVKSRLAIAFCGIFYIFGVLFKELYDRLYFTADQSFAN